MMADGFSLSVWTCSQFLKNLLLPNILLVHVMVAKMAVFSSQDSSFWSYQWDYWITSSPPVCLGFLVKFAGGFGVLNWKSWKAYSSTDFLCHSILCLGFLGSCGCDCWQKYHILNSWRMILVGQIYCIEDQGTRILNSWSL